MKRFLLSVALVALCLVVVTTAAMANPSADCYAHPALEKFRPVPSREVVIAIDETTVLPSPVTEALLAKLTKALQPGDHVFVVGFSAVSAEHFLQERGNLQFDRAPDAAVKKDMPVRRITELEQCVTLQHHARLQKVLGIVKEATARASSKIPYSEIIGAVREVGQHLQASDTPQRVLVLVSDGLEHSRHRSFYKDKGVRLLEPAGEVAAYRARGLLSNLKGARVYVFGGGLAPPEAGFRDQSELLALEGFWQRYVQESGGQLVAFGKPVPLVDFK